ncbi:Short-chain dehydrogenase/reductase SDR [Rhodanobacter fulvus Jip2]|uniref:Short-chain dehydrogenase/reductase SDR n=1 Tax=Rhodanobacter fulvus Jip2 TaxID=1163408 RepID=I4VKC5_9GAMM|nr:SDR family oxidoreductase [Rhodanobacter fulvus]EIL87666.1 Short-chain dehydrogenase/reductase SDR [Rhodanobacter fulvus Jip2]
MAAKSTNGSILIIGASRGLGHAMAAEFLEKGWQVIGTVRGEKRTLLHDLADENPGRVEIAHLDITVPEQIAALHDRFAARRFDILFVNAGTANTHQGDTIADVSTQEFAEVMVTNALGPMRVIEALQDLVTATGLIGVMSSGQGSVGNNENGGREVYRASKAALNQCMRSYAARHADEQRALLLMAPGWIRTDLGGPDARFSMEETVPDIVDVIIGKQGKPGLEYLDRFGEVVTW